MNRRFRPAAFLGLAALFGGLAAAMPLSAQDSNLADYSTFWKSVHTFPERTCLQRHHLKPAGVQEKRPAPPRAGSQLLLSP